ncbi:SMP-30/gluconolactonase/LRE family protein [Tenacibaculum dicentrarchi]|uniref:SMP-30/gluconolactonase/LRE family protein n=1 Tax=Tenacibaculum dicentrarchi TaxID=669041 RepID=UPI000C7B7B88|nr:putative SMP-30/Gluconolaconase/LRE domain protein [Tenacibaculum dicentrarchi]
MRKVFLTKILLLTALVYFTACSKNEELDIKTIESDFPDVVSIKEEGLFPESFDFDETSGQFIVGSFRKGEIGKVNPQTGEYKVFIKGDDRDLHAVTGVFTDEKRNRLIVATTDIEGAIKTTPNYKGDWNRIIIYNLKTGKQQKVINYRLDIGGWFKSISAFPNDIAVDDDGNIFITNSIGTMSIYKIDKDLKASIYAKIPNDNVIDGFGLNGIVYHSKTKQLIVSRTNAGKIYSIRNVNGKPTTLALNYNNVEGVDGLEIDNEGNLVMVINGQSKVIVARIDVVSPSDAISIVRKKEYATELGVFPTSVVSVKNKGTFVLYSNLPLFFQKEYTHNDFKIVNIESL